MFKIYKKHGSAFKAKVAIEAIKEKKVVGEICQEYCVAPNQVTTWKKRLEDDACKIFEGKAEKHHKEEIDRLHRVIGQVTAERDFLERALNR
jgi:transposase